MCRGLCVLCVESSWSCGGDGGRSFGHRYRGLGRDCDVDDDDDAGKNCRYQMRNSSRDLRSSGRRSGRALVASGFFEVGEERLGNRSTAAVHLGTVKVLLDMAVPH